MKTPLLKDEPKEPTPNRLGLPDWWPGVATDRGRRNQLWLYTVPPFFGAVLLLAEGYWFWALLPLALGIFYLVANLRLRAAQRVLDEAERQLRLDEPVTNNRDPDDDMSR